MQPALYRDLVPWYRLVDPPADHLAEATSYTQALERGATPRPETLLELGAGAGHVRRIFSTETRTRLLTEFGYRVEIFDRPLDDDSFDQVFLGRRA